MKIRFGCGDAGMAFNYVTDEPPKAVQEGVFLKVKLNNLIIFIDICVHGKGKPTEEKPGVCFR